MHSNGGCVLWVLLAAVVLQLCLGYDYTKRTVGKSFKGDCDYPGYVPGGGVPNIQPIPSPVCEAFTSLLGYAFGVSGHAKKTAAALSNVAGQRIQHKLNTITSASRKMLTAMHRADKILKIATTGSAVFGAAFGLVSALTSPTPNDILEKVNEAFEEMTKETNIRFAKMTEYVDAKLLALEKQTIMRHFDTLQLKMKNCITKPSPQGVLECQEQVVESFNTETHHFLRLLSKFKVNSNTISLAEVKTLEVILIAFRDYASEHVVELKDLIDIYQVNATFAETKKTKIIRILCFIKNRGKFYHDYAKWAYREIRRVHILTHLDSDGQLKLDLQKSGIKTVYASKWSWTLAQKGIEIHPKCPAMTESAKQSCMMSHFQPMKNPTSAGVGSFPAAQAAADRENAITVEKLQIDADKEAKDHCKSFFNNYKNDVETYWEKELLPADMWKKASEVATASLTELDALSQCHQPLLPDDPLHDSLSQDDLPDGDSPKADEPQGLGSPSDGSARDDSPQGGSNNGDAPQGGSNYGDSPQGGSDNGDTPQGGSDHDGTPQGGSHHGGTPQGDSNNGDSPQGGSNNGDTPQGGSHHGGTPQGGSSNVDTPQGGSDHGDTPQGGSDSGDTPQGGSNNGHTPQGGSDHGDTPQGGSDNGDTPPDGSGDSSIGGA